MSLSGAPPVARDDALAAQLSPAGLLWLADGQNRDAENPAAGWWPYPHLRLLNRHLVELRSGRVTRLLVAMPPRHGKSMLVSVALPAWWLATSPKQKVIIASATAHLAEDFSRQALRLLAEWGPPVFGVAPRRDAQSAGRWETTNGGVCIAAGVGGQITGRGADLLIIDDPVKSSQDARSPTMREHQWQWWLSTARTRLQRNGRVVVVMTRWHEDDLAGRLLRGPNASEWVQLRLPALAEPNDPLNRQPGEPLCPQLIPPHQLDATRRELGAYWWHALYQGEPGPAEGQVFRREWARRWTPHPDGWLLHDPAGPRLAPRQDATLVAAADLAGTERTTGDWTAIALAAAVGPELVLLDMVRTRAPASDLPTLVADTCRRWRPAVMLIEEAMYGTAVIQQLARQGLPVRAVRPDRDKVARALLAAAKMEAGHLWLPTEAPWLNDLEHELWAFPTGEHDDQVDAIAYLARAHQQLDQWRQPHTGGRTVMGGLLTRPHW